MIARPWLIPSLLAGLLAFGLDRGHKFLQVDTLGWRGGEVVPVTGFWWSRTADVLVRFGLMLAIGGAVSNALDRLLYGAVADFFHFHWQDWSFYIFNLADVAITLGVLLLLLDFIGIGRGKPA